MSGYKKSNVLGREDKRKFTRDGLLVGGAGRLYALSERGRVLGTFRQLEDGSLRLEKGSVGDLVGWDRSFMLQVFPSADADRSQCHGHNPEHNDWCGAELSVVEDLYCDHCAQAFDDDFAAHCETGEPMC